MNSELKDNSLRQQSPFRLRTGFEIISRLRMNRVNISGLEHLSEIPKDKPIVVVPTHLTDLDLHLAIGSLVKHLDLSIAYLSALKKAEPITRWGMKMFGESNFFPVDYTIGNEENKWRALPFNPNNFTPMIEAMKNGKAMVIVAHNPVYNHVLPDRGGYGAVYLAQAAHAVILPIAVNYHVRDEDIGKSGSSATGELFKKYPRAEADVTIGNALELPPIDLDSLNKKVNLETINQELRNQSDILMQRLASMLPKEKRGKWENR